MAEDFSEVEPASVFGGAIPRAMLLRHKGRTVGPITVGSWARSRAGTDMNIRS